MHQEWIDSRQAWLEFVMSIPDWQLPTTDIDRENNLGSYVPGNIRIVTRKQNTNNRRVTYMVEYNGEKTPYQYFRAKYTPLWSKVALRYHLERGKPVADCLALYRATHDELSV